MRGAVVERKTRNGWIEDQERPNGRPGAGRWKTRSGSMDDQERADVRLGAVGWKTRSSTV